MASKIDRQDKNEQFIRVFEEERSLWDICSPEYTNKDVKKRSKQRIGEMFGMTEDEVQKKINILRTYYTRELHKERDSIKGYISRWPHFKSMEFIKFTIKPRIETPTMSMDEGFATASTTSDTSRHEQQHDHLDSHEEPIVLYRTNDTDDEFVRAEQDARYFTGQKRKNSPKRIKVPYEFSRYDQRDDRAELDLYSPYQKRKNVQTASTESQTERDTSNETNRNIVVKTEKDADELFGETVGLSIKKLPSENAKMFAKMKIFEVMFQAQTGTFQQPQTATVNYVATTSTTSATSVTSSNNSTLTKPE